MIPPGRAGPQPGHTLPVGARLRDYEITGLIGEGGFGIVYLAWDHSLQRKVAVKEYMPASMASRQGGSWAIAVKSGRHADTFRAGLRSFVNEARLLARFDHPSLVKVYRYWEENGTAYMAMPFYEGPTLKAALAGLGHVPSEAEVRAWLRPLLDALSVMHAAQCYHRDIAPDNILLTPTGPLLLDFGAARRVIGDMTHALTVVLKPGYAPIEQYGDVATMAQGPWTDLYALACVVYYAITGTTPMSSVERLMDDRMVPLAVSAAGRYSPAFLRAIDHALAVRPQDRPQNERRFRDLLDADLPVSPVLPPAAPPPAAPRPAASAFPKTEDASYGTVPGTLTPTLPTQVMPKPAPAPITRTEPMRPVAPIAVPIATPAAPAAPAVAPARAPAAPPAAPAKPHAASPDAAVPRSLAPWIVAAVLLLLAGLGVVAALWKPAQRSAELPQSPASTASAPAAPASPAAVAAPASAAASAQAPAPTVAPPLSEPAIEAPAAPERRRPEARAEPRPEPARRSDPPTVKPAPRTAGARCSDILQKASLEPLTADEAAYLKRECR